MNMRIRWTTLLLSGPLLAGVSDKSVTVTPNPAVYRQDDTVTFRLTITNHGPDTDRFRPTIGTFHYLTWPVSATCGYGLASVEPEPGSGILPGYFMTLLSIELAAGETQVCDFTLIARFVGHDSITILSQGSLLGNVDPTPDNPPFEYSVFAPSTPVPSGSQWSWALMIVAVATVGWVTLRRNGRYFA